LSPLEQTPEGVPIRVKAIPCPSRTEVVGLPGDAIRRFLSEKLSVRLISGEASRSKVVAVQGIDVQAAMLRLNL
jgi:hypothetical protein